MADGVWTKGDFERPGLYWAMIEKGFGYEYASVRSWEEGGVRRRERSDKQKWSGKVVGYCRVPGPPFVRDLLEDSTCPGSGPEPADRPEGEHPGMERLEAIEGRLDALEDTARWENKGTAQELEGRVDSLESNRDWTMRAVADLLDRIKRMEPDRRDQHNRIVVLEAKLMGIRLALADGPEQEDE